MVRIPEIFGESFGNPGNLVGIHGIPWESRESWKSHGNPGNPMGIQGISWESRESWKSRESGIRRFPLGHISLELLMHFVFLYFVLLLVTFHFFGCISTDTRKY